MKIAWEVVQWFFATAGFLAAVSSYFFNRRLNKQKLNLDKLKTKFDYILIERNKVLMALNSRVSNIEMWLRETLRIEGYEDIDVDLFKDILSKLEITLVHGQVVLPSEVYNPLCDFLELLRNCLDIYYDECEKIGCEPMDKPPLATFADKLYEPKIKEMINTVKVRIGEELSDE